MKLLIVAIEQDIRKIYQKMIRRIDASVIITESSSAEEAIFLVLRNQIDLILSETKLPDRSGFELASALFESKLPCKTILIFEDDNDLALEAIRSHCCGYLSKPFSSDRFNKTLSEALGSLEREQLQRNLQNNPIRKIRVNSSHGFWMDDLDQIVYCQSNGAYTQVYMSNKQKYTSSYNLGRIEELLSPFHFMRINRSIIINTRFLDRIDRYDHTCRLMFNDEELKFTLSKTYQNQFEQKQIKAYH